MADATFRKNCLDSHNAWRKKHGVSPLKLNDDINKVAQKWAEHLAKHDEFAHSKPAQRQHKGNQMGENIAMKYTSDNQPYTGEEATNQWYSEIERFNFNTASGPSTGHFTQVVWKTCTDLGVGKAQTKGGKWLVVANYHPAGNFVGDYKANVLPPVSGKVEVPDTGMKSGGGGACKPHAAHGGGGGGGGTTRVSTSTQTKTETINGKTKVTKIITKTTTHPDGRTEVETTEQVTEK